MHAFLTSLKGRIPALVQAFTGLMLVFGMPVPEGATEILQSNTEMIVGGVIVLTAFVPGLFQKKK